MGVVAAPDGSEPRRATGTSLAAIVLSGACFGAVMLLHLVRRDMDPLQTVMSEYANGAHGNVMTVAFYAVGLATLALGFRLRRAILRRGVLRAVPILLALAGVALLLAGVFEVERAVVPDTLQETLHSVASIGAFVLLITAMLLFSHGSSGDPRWRSFAPVSWTAASTAALAAMASPWVDQSRWSGSVQRLLGLAVLIWLLLTAIRIRSNAFRGGRRSG